MTSKTTLDFSKPVMTSDGTLVTIISTNGRGGQPILGYIGTAIRLASWNSNGAYLEHGVRCSSSDIGNVPEVDPFEELKAAHAAGKTIEYRRTDDGGWTVIEHPSWLKECEYRIKPEPIGPFAEIKAACAAGKTIECRRWSSEWVPIRYPSWDTAVENYRIAEDPYPDYETWVKSAPNMYGGA